MLSRLSQSLHRQQITYLHNFCVDLSNRYDFDTAQYIVRGLHWDNVQPDRLNIKIRVTMVGVVCVQYSMINYHNHNVDVDADVDDSHDCDPV